jgi:dynein heavy chain
MQSLKKKQQRIARMEESFDWGDDAIEKFSSNPPQVATKHVEDMDSKIARVHQRRKEAAERAKRRAKLPPPPPPPDTPVSRLPKALGNDVDSAEVVTAALNEHYDALLSTESETYLMPSDIKFPLWIYIDSKFQEVISTPDQVEEDTFASVLQTSSAPECSPRGKGLGRWKTCNVLKREEDGTFFVKTKELDAEYLTVSRFEVLFPLDDPQNYESMISDALRRRCMCVSLLKYSFNITCMPFDEAVVCTLPQEQAQRIMSKTQSPGPLSSDKAAIDDLFNEARDDYEFVMKSIIYRLNLFDPENAGQIAVLNLPTTHLQPGKNRVIPQSAIYEIPRYPLSGRIDKYTRETFLSSPAAINALQKAISFGVDMRDYKIFNLRYEKSLTLERFDRFFPDMVMSGVRAIKVEWPQKTAKAMRAALEEDEEGKYDPNQRDGHKFLNTVNNDKLLVDKVNHFMSDVLTNLVRDSVATYSQYIQDLCDFEVDVTNIRSIQSVYPENSIYRRLNLQPLFSISLRVTEEKFVLNQPEVDESLEAIAKWKKSKEAEDGGKCPFKPEPEVWGFRFEFSNDLEAFKKSVLEIFDSVLMELSDVPHLRKAVMEKIFFPVPQFISSASAEEDFVRHCRVKIDEAMDQALAPLRQYLTLYKDYEAIVNVENANYIAGKVSVTRVEADSAELELPVQVDLKQIAKIVGHHNQEIEDIKKALPLDPLQCGLFVVELVQIRNLLLAKHDSIISEILTTHVGHCREISLYLESEFDKIFVELNKRPEDIEGVAAMEDYMDGLKSTMKTLGELSGDMMAYHGLLDEYKYKVDYDVGHALWQVYAMPGQVDAKMDEVRVAMEAVRKQLDALQEVEQVAFGTSLAQLEKDVAALQEHTDLAKVDETAVVLAAVEVRVAEAQESIRLYNSREVLFGKEVTDYEDFGRVVKMLDPYSGLWNTASAWLRQHKAILSSKFVDVDAEQVEASVDKFNLTISKSLKFFQKNGLDAQMNIAKEIKDQVEAFKPEVPMMVTLRNPGMRDRHWQQIKDALNVDLMPIEDFTTERILAFNLKEQLDVVQKIGESAAKEYQIENALDKMEGEWSGVHLQIHPYRETGTGVLKGVDEINVVLDEHITMTQTIMFSAFKGPFEERIDEWNRKLLVVSEVLEVWLAVQRNWLYLQPIFESADINRQLPTEGKKFSIVDKNWRSAISSAKNHSLAIEFCDSDKLLERFKDSEIMLDQVQKGLSDYLETKRSVFARFYFLSNDELLSILSESKDPKRVQPHLKKCFEGIDKVKFLPDLKIDRIISPESEEVMLKEVVDPVEKNVENWMLEIEAMMKISIRHVMEEGIHDYAVTARPKWMQKHAGMIVLNGSQKYWTSEMEDLFINEGSQGPKTFYEQQVAQLADMTILVRGKLNKASRTTIGALTVIDVHARDVIKRLADQDVGVKEDFGWTSQLRYYWQEDMICQMVAATRPYGYEYLGNSFRLVITPLTDKCYLTLMGALQMIFGGAPAGPAGTGKTETTKDLAKALAMQCVVFNCSDGLDFVAMGKFFKGLAACGAWACFDEFNRINIEVLSVIGQQIMSIQSVIRSGETRMIFEGSDIFVSDRFAVFITMNPGYAGRSALPDSLQALFRPVAMMVPDYALIGEIMFFAFGFTHGRDCGAKMVTTFKLCSEQLSAQPHYDYGMRAVKTVITAAGNLKQKEPDADEMVLLLRALQDVNIPKFLAMDLPLFEGIISDLFPGKKRPDLDYGALMRTMKEAIGEKGLQPHPWFISKVIQLYEMIVVRHGLMLVGPTGGGKSCNLHVLEATLGKLKDEGIKGFAYEHVQIFQLNPKSITMGQMYGQVDPNTMEWQDGIMSTMYRNATVEGDDRKWIVFDGPVDAIWIENMNTVLDDNKKLCLNSGEIIKMSGEMTMMFEVEDLTVASPATVSRVGIIYMEPKGLGLDVLVQSWLQRLPPGFPATFATKLNHLFDLYMMPAITFMRTNCKELCPSVDNNLAESLMRTLDCFLEPLYPKPDGEPQPAQTLFRDTAESVEPLFLFALIWSVGATTDEAGRGKFDAYIRHETFSNKTTHPLPKDGDVYDYVFMRDKKRWATWIDIGEKYNVDIKQSFSELIIPTKDTIRNTYLQDLLLNQRKHILMVGNTGTGKTINISNYLMGQSKVQGRAIPQSVVPLTITFSANASANQTQDFLDSKMDKRRKGVYGPAAGKRFFVYVDDLNMPTRETYGAQPPIEILRQWFDQAGWYDRKELTFRKIIDLVFVASMGPPGGGRQDVTARFLRHFNIIGYVEMADSSKALIFNSILSAFLADFDGGLVSMAPDIVNSSIKMFNAIVLELLPTPSKAHYTFNLRDLAKVFQGILMASNKKVSDQDGMARLWVHEVKRVFADRFTNPTDHGWLDTKLQGEIEDVFKLNWTDVVNVERLVYGDFMLPDVEPTSRVYTEIDDFSKLKTVVEEYLHDHNAESKQPMPLVMFSDALEHVARIARILRQPQGNALLLGVGGSGRQSMTKLATYVCGFHLETVEIVKGYSMNDWKEDLKRILMFAGVKDEQTTFLFSDTQIIDERMVEDVNNILNSGDVPNLYLPEDIETISSACRVECQRKKIPATKLNVFAQYIIRVRRNIHLCTCMSPLGEAFRNRLRNFPSIVNCSTIDWYDKWPAEALQSVGMALLTKANLGLGDNTEATVEMFKSIHLSVTEQSAVFYEVMRRYNYVTPTSYLELLSTFGKILGTKRDEVEMKKKRLQIGLDKLSETEGLVGGMQEELTVLAPILVKTQKEVSDMMVVITKDREAAAVTKAQVEVEEGKANAKAAEAKAIADDAQKDLAEAIPALEEAVKCLNDLKKADIDEVKSLKTPPGGVVLTIKVVCFMFMVKPVKKNDPDNPGKKIEDFWEAGKTQLLSDAKAFLQSLFDFDKDNIPDKVIKAIDPYMTDPAFTPKAIEKASKACTAICMWARAMHKYHFVALGVAPKRAALKEAEAELAVVMSVLAKAKAELQAVNDKLDELEKSFNEAVEKKDGLEKKEASCKVQLSNADKLIGGLGGEKVRWGETVSSLNIAATNVLGDIILSSGTISYLGAFTGDFRNKLVAQWALTLAEVGIPSSEGANIEMTLANPVLLRSWQLCLLPSDSLSSQNALIMDNGRRWPLLIDPQGQANRYIKSMSKDKTFAVNGMDTVKLSDKNFLRTLENGVQFGRWVLLENIQETLDAALEPILLQQTFKQGGQIMMKLGDNIIPYNDTFRFFMTTKLANPHYAPEVSVKVSLLNFTITEGGLEEQLLGVTVAEEMPDLSEQKANLVVQNAANNKRLFDIESEILHLLSNSTGNILDDTVLIDTLAQSKKTSEEIKEQMAEATAIEDEIEKQSELYRSAAKRAAKLYFVVADLGYVDPMYQYSLQWFTGLYIRGINGATPAGEVDQRVVHINEFFTMSVYNNICRSLFERHKILFSFIMCVKILQGEGLVDSLEYRFLLSGISGKDQESEYPQDASDWLPTNIWADLLSMSGLEAFKEFPTEFPKQLATWKEIFDSHEPQKCAFPEAFAQVTPLQRLCLLRCLRRDKTELAMQDYITAYLDERFIQPPPFDLKACYNDSTPISPLIFILSTGSDPNKDLDILAAQLDMQDRLKRIALGQGQGKKASNLVEKGCANGDWVMLQNCHLSISWMPTLELICENFEPDKINPEFRLWLTSMPSESFPVAVLQNGVKITKEPPSGLRANLKNTYIKLNDAALKKTNKIQEFQKLLFGLAFFHAIVIERRKYGPLGWNIPYSFNDTDMDITAAQLELYVSSYEKIPFKVLQQLASVVNYGGRITDDKDMRTSDILISDFFNEVVFNEGHSFSESGLYKSITPDPDAPHASYIEYIDSLPLHAEPEVFGMHSNANITSAITSIDETFTIILSLQPRVVAGAGASREDQIIEMAADMEGQLFPEFDLEGMAMLYPTDYYESMNTVLVQEGERYNKLIKEMHVSLRSLQKALKGLVVLSAELEAMGTAMFNQWVPDNWTKVAYPSLKPCNAWFKDLMDRLKFLSNWVEGGVPPTYWISGFFFPQGFLTAALQNFARKYAFPIDTVSNSFVMKPEAPEDLKRPDDGCYIFGLYLEGARWGAEQQSLIQPKPKELFSPMPVIHMMPVQHRPRTESGIYRCPVYKVLTRTGVLSTTGHSTNFVTWIEIPSNLPTIYRSSLVSETNAQAQFCDNSEWIKGGVACFCSLRYNA